MERVRQRSAQSRGISPGALVFAPTRKVDRVGQEKQLRISNCGDYFVLVLCTQVNMMFVMLL